MGDAWVQFRIRYYIFALVFVVFYVETVFLYPWAMSFDVLGVSVFIEALSFVLILIVGLVYAWRKGALDPNAYYDELILPYTSRCRTEIWRAQGCRSY